MFGFVLLLVLFTASFAAAGLITYKFMRKRAAMQISRSSADEKNDTTLD